jgi:hypothetical protein
VSNYTISTNVKRGLLFLTAIPLIVAVVYFSYNIYTLSNQRAAIKKDYSIVNNITRGLLSVNAWKDYLVQIVTHRIDDFEFTPEQEAVMKVQLEQVLHSVIDKADSLVHRKQKTFKGKVRQFAFNAFVDEKKIHAKVPVFSQTIIDEIKKPANKEKLKNLALAKIAEYGSITYDSTNDVARMEYIFATYNVCDLDSFNSKCLVTLTDIDNQMYLYTFLVLSFVGVFLLLWLICRKSPELYNTLYTVSILMALIVLIAGLTSPMIEIDARIKEMSFLLMGETISFHDQVIFFQSKSIIDVVHILIETGKLDSVFVGVLILIFSILFPLTKLICSKIYMGASQDLRENKFVKFFALKSGKWSMADVYVVAIFMAYIGFKGILDNQLNKLNMKTESLASISTNETTLQPGFLLFVCFVLFTLLLSTILERISVPAIKEDIIKVTGDSQFA